MKPNIFLVANNVTLGDEDALTACWHYLICVVPGLGQAFVDEVCRLSGLPPSSFLGAIDHPPGDQENHPDLLLQCSDYNLLFEHKLDSSLGPRQLHRYLALAQNKGWKLALLAATPIKVDDEVRQSPAYVCPTDAAHPGHFLWQDIHRILSASEHHLAREFRDFLEMLGLGTFSWAGLGNPFSNREAANALLVLYGSIRSVFTEPGVRCLRSAGGSLIYQVRTPFPPIHLLNIGPIESVAFAVPSLRGPVMALWVWARRRSRERRVLPTGNGLVPGASMPIVVSDGEDARSLPYDRDVFCERFYYVPLGEILRNSPEESAQRLVTFVRTAVGHLRGEVAALPADHPPGDSSLPPPANLSSQQQRG